MPLRTSGVPGECPSAIARAVDEPRWRLPASITASRAATSAPAVRRPCGLSPSALEPRQATRVDARTLTNNVVEGLPRLGPAGLGSATMVTDLRLVMVLVDMGNLA
jgi:hypothetical protein